ncbi:hypothetical protein ACIA5C_45660 [Actinoplanes sp. NPDC051343]|uniref:hypothetical protein n=1 Tax=Actinoplanes sp. NPDC051343 TaxID=3363906 RepID=UPI00379336EF
MNSPAAALVGLDFTATNIREIRAALPEVRGLAVTLADRATRPGTRSNTYLSTRRALEALINSR